MGNYGLLNTWPYMSHLKVKIKRPIFQKNSTKQEDRELYNVSLGFVYSAIFLPKRPFQITFRIFFSKTNIRNITMKAPVALFKKKSRELCLFLKAKSQNLINTVARCLHKDKDAKKTVARKKCKVRFFF